MKFLKENMRFSFKLGGIDARKIEYHIEQTQNGNELATVYSFPGGLKITNIARKYEKYGAYEWVNYIENTSDKPTEIISELWDCDVELPIEHEENCRRIAYRRSSDESTKLYAPSSGTNVQRKEFYSDAELDIGDKKQFYLFPNEPLKQFSCRGGRSSNGQAPFFNVLKNGTGYIFAVGWSGQWKCETGRTNDTLIFRSKIEDTEFRVLPGERFRTSSVTMLPYKADFADAQNIWRRLLKEHFSVIGNERQSSGPLCTGVWGGMKSSSVIDRIKSIKSNKLPFEYIWMDAGWYGIDTKPTPDEFEGDWGSHTGDWRVSPLIHPDGLRDVSKAIHDAGMKFLLWFEPERVVDNAPIVKEHPEYLITIKETDNIYIKGNNLYNLGNEEAWQYLYNTLAGLIESLNIDCYRNDFNTDPLPYWRFADTPERRGITEIKYVNGLYRLWDALLERFPRLIIDNCAGGGRRIDIEMLRRSIPLWRSDMMCPANYEIEAAQDHNLCFNLWMPYSGTGTGRPYDEYRFRSAYSASLTANYSYSERDTSYDIPEKIAFIKKYATEYLKVRPYFSEDFYALTELTDKSDVWCAMQFNRPEQQDGLIEVFVRENTSYESACFKLRGIDKNRNYTFTDLDGGEFTVSGRELSENGLKLTLTQKRKAKLYIYKAIS